MKKSIFIIILLLFCFILNLSAQELGNLSNSIPEEEYKVYSDILKQLREGESICIVREKTGVHPREKEEAFLKENFGDKVDNNLIKEFIAINNAQPRMLQNKFYDSLNIVIISEAEYNEIFNTDNGWERFYLKYSRSAVIIELSRVAFNANKTKALLYYGVCFDSGKGGVGYYILLKRENDRWVIEEEVRAWVA